MAGDFEERILANCDCSKDFDTTCYIWATSSGFPNKSYLSQPFQLQRIARKLKLLLY